ncbi:MAG: hypothetical protein ACRD1B_03395 [Thermoanaerobaculia bacterium]
MGKAVNLQHRLRGYVRRDARYLDDAALAPIRDAGRRLAWNIRRAAGNPHEQLYG